MRAETAGFDGVELHGAHGYILCAFLEPRDQPARTTAGAARFENRTRIVFDIIAGVRARTRPDFQLGLRLSPERFGLRFADQRELAQQMLSSMAVSITSTCRCGTASRRRWTRPTRTGR